jgi:hypothetical protein
MFSCIYTTYDKLNELRQFQKQTQFQAIFEQIIG